MQDLSNYSNIQTAVTENEKFIEDLVAISNLKAVNIDTTIVEINGNDIKIEGDRTSLVNEYVVLGHEIAYITSASYSDPYTTLTLAREQIGTKQDTTDLTGYYIRSVDIFTDVKSWEYNSYSSSKNQVFPFNLESGQVIIYDEIANWGKGKTYSLKRKKSAIYIFKGFDNEKMLKYVGFADNKYLYGANTTNAERVKIDFNDKFIQWYNVNIRRQQILKYIKPKEFMVNVLEYSTDMVKYINGNIEDDFNTTNYVFLNEYKKFKDILGEYAKTGVRFYFNELEELCITTDLTVSNLTPTGIDITNTNLLDIQKKDESGFIINKITGTYYERTALYDFENASQFNNQYVIYGRTLDVDAFTLLSSDDEYNLLTITDTNLANFTTQYDLVILKDDTTGFELHGKVIYYEGTSPNVETTISFQNADKDGWLDYFGRIDYLKTLSYDSAQDFTLYYIRNELPIIYKHSNSFSEDTKNSKLNIPLRPQITGQSEVVLLQTSAKFGATSDLTNAKYTGQFENIDNIYGTFDDGTSFGGLTYNQELVQFTDPDNYPPLFVLSNKASDYSPNDLIEGNIYTIVELGDTDWNAIGFVGTPTVNENFTKNSTLGSGTGLARDLVRGENALLKYNTFDNSNLEINISGTDSSNYNAKINFKNTITIADTELYDVLKTNRTQITGSVFEINATDYGNLSVGDVLTIKQPVSYTDSDERAEFDANKDTNWIIERLFVDGGLYYMQLNGNIKDTFDFTIYPSTSIVYLQEFYILGNPVIEYTSGFESSNDTSIEEYDEQEQVIDGKLLNFEGVGKLTDYYKRGFAGIETDESDKKYILPLQIRNHPELQKFDLITITDDIYTGYDGNTDFMILGIEESDVTKGDTNKYYVMNINNFDATEDTFDVEKLLDFVPVNDITYNSQGNEGLPQQTNEVTTDTNIITSNDDVYGSVSIKPIGQGDLKADVVSLEDGLLSIDNVVIGDTKYTSFLDYTTSDNEYKIIKIDNEYVLTLVESYSSIANTAELIVVKRNFLNKISTATNIVSDRLVSFFEIISGSFDGDLITQNLKAGNQTDFVRLDIENGTQIASTSNVSILNKTNILDFNGTTNESSLKLNGTSTSTSVNAGSFIIGKTYIITTLGDTNWVSIGASSNTLGIMFTATGVGSGTGVAEIAYYQFQAGKGLVDSSETFNGLFAGNGDLTQNNYLKYDGTTLSLKGNVDISGGSVDIDAHSSILKFTESDSYIRLNYDGGLSSNYGLRINETSSDNKFIFDSDEFTIISQGIVDISNNTNYNRLYMDVAGSYLHLNTNGTATTSDILQLGDDTTNSYLKYTASTLELKSTGIIDISNTNNALYFDPVTNGDTSFIKLNKSATYYSQQLGYCTDYITGVEDNYNGAFIGDAEFTATNYLKYKAGVLSIKGDITITGGNATVTFRQDEQPTDYKIGDIWVDTDADERSVYVSMGGSDDLVAYGEGLYGAGYYGTNWRLMGTNNSESLTYTTVKIGKDAVDTGKYGFLVTTTGWVDINNTNNRLYFDPVNIENSYLKIATDGSKGSLEVGDITSNSYFKYSSGGLDVKTTGTVNFNTNDFSLTTTGILDIGDSSNKLYMNLTDSYLYLNSNTIKIGANAIGTNSGLYVADNSSWTTANNGIQVDLSGSLDIKSEGTIDISNTNNSLLFAPTGTTSYIKLATVDGSEGEFQVGQYASSNYFKFSNANGVELKTNTSVEIVSTAGGFANELKFDGTNSYIRMNDYTIQLGYNAVGGHYGLYVANDSTWASADNGVQFDVESGNFNLKSLGTITLDSATISMITDDFTLTTAGDLSITNDDNSLIFDGAAHTGALKLNKSGVHYQQQIGYGLTDTVDTGGFNGLFCGDPDLSNGNYIKYKISTNTFKFGENTKIAGVVTTGDVIEVVEIGGDKVCKYGEINKSDNVFGFDFTSPTNPTTEYFKLADSTNIVTAGSFVVDSVYTITTLGSTDFTLIGASSNTVGVIFQATGVGLGTGTATQYTQGMEIRTQGDINISNTNNELNFDSSANTSYLKMNADKIKIGYVFGIYNGIQIADNSTWASATNGIQFNTDVGDLDIKTQGDINISNDNNVLNFDSSGVDSYLKLNKTPATGTYYNQQIGNGLEDNDDNAGTTETYGGWFVGDADGMSHYIKYHQGNGKFSIKVDEIDITQTSKNTATEKAVNGDFSLGTTGWTVGTNWSIGSGVATHTAGATGELNNSGSGSITAGKYYKISMDITTTVTGSGQLYVGGTTSSSISFRTSNSPETITVTLLAIDSTTPKIISASAWAGTVDNFSVEEIENASSPIIIMRDSNGDISNEIRITDDTDDNILYGKNCGLNLLAGSKNSIFGKDSFVYNVEGIANNIFGYGSFTNNSASDNNCVFGTQSLTTSSNTFNNIVIGNFSLDGNIGDNNSVLGHNALGSCVDNNIGIGYEAGTFLSGGIATNTGSESCIFIGANTKSYTNAQENEIVIGYDTTGNGTNTTTIGNSSTTDTYIQGTLHADIDNLNIYETSWTAVSTNLRSQIITVTHSLGFDVTKLAVKFYWNSSASDATAREITGFCANIYGLPTGYEVEGVDSNNIKINTASGGMWRLAGELTSGDFYKIKVIKL